jgi:Ca-activated chloride channel family protein
MLSNKIFHNTRPDGFPVLEIVSEGTETETETPRRFVPLKHTALSGEVTGPLADLCLTQTFGFSETVFSHPIEAAYRFPLPGDAAVTGVVVRFGEVEIVATLKKREEAEAEYEEAKQNGQQAAITTRESVDVFTLRVAGIAPGEDVTVQTRYVQLARDEGSADEAAKGQQRWSLRIPLTTSPRYVRTDEIAANSPHIHGQPLFLLRDPGHRFTLDLLLSDAEDILCPTHALAVEEAGEGKYRLRLQDSAVLPDRDCVLTWRAAATEAGGPGLHITLHRDDTCESDPQLYFLAQVAPPRETLPGETLPREIILLVDRSGSMEGKKWEATDKTVSHFLKTLTPRDTFALGLFHTTTRWFHSTPLAATDSIRDSAITFLLNTRDSGGTNLGVALEEALLQPATTEGDKPVSRHVLLITDAEVSDEGRLLRLADQERKKDPEVGRRISVVCIDAAPNSFLAVELAERGGGLARFLTSDPAENDIVAALTDVMAEWEAPALTGLSLQVNRPGAMVAGRGTGATITASDSTVLEMGDLPGGRARWLVGRLPLTEDNASPLHFLLTTGYGKREQVIAENFPVGEKASHPALKSLYGARIVQALEFLETAYYNNEELAEALRRLGYSTPSATEAGTLYVENGQKRTSDFLRPMLARESLKFGVASAATAFIAVRSEKGERVVETVAIGNALPSGWSGGFAASGAVACAPAASPPYAPMMMRVPASQGNGLVERLKRFKSEKRGEALSTAPAYMQRERADQLPDEGEWVEDISGLYMVYFGMPTFEAGENTTTIYDNLNRISGPWIGFSGDRYLKRFWIELSRGNPKEPEPDRGLVFLVYFGESAVPHSRFYLVDMLQAGYSQLLNLPRLDNNRLRIVLEDQNGVWSSLGKTTRRLTVRLG